MLKGTIIGNLGADAEIKQIGGKTRYTMRVAHSKRLPDGASETTWVEVITNERPALLKHLIKGVKVYASGMLTASAYIDKNGAPKASNTIWSDTLELLSAAPVQQQVQEVTPQPVQTVVEPTPIQNDLPF